MKSRRNVTQFQFCCNVQGKRSKGDEETQDSVPEQQSADGEEQTAEGEGEGEGEVENGDEEGEGEENGSEEGETGDDDSGGGVDKATSPPPAQ